jgi:hypothetical protein
MQFGHDVMQEVPAVGVAKAFIRIGKPSTDIAEPQRTEQRIAQRMNQHIPIGMRDDSANVRYAHSADDDSIAVAITVSIEAVPNSHQSLTPIVGRPNRQLTMCNPSSRL